MSHGAGSTRSASTSSSATGSVAVLEDRILIRNLTIEDPVVWHAASSVPDPELWLIHCVVNGVVSDFVLTQSMKLSDATREMCILSEILSDWLLQLSAIPRYGVDAEAIAARDFKRRADEQFHVVIDRLRCLSE